ncbi:MAG: aminopeptidase P N-terminal domain-containing protein [Candidatus Binatia bacterium]
MNGPDAEVLAGRREAVLATLQASKGVLLLPRVPATIYSADVHYRYRTASNTRYLSGFEEPAALVLSASGHEDGYTLFVQPRDQSAETWTGRRAGVEGASAEYRVDHAYPLDELHEVLEKHLADAERLYYGYGICSETDRAVLDLVHRVNATRPRRGGAPIEITEAGAILDEMRLFKSSEEVELMRRACGISAAAHARLMEIVTPGMIEYQAEAYLEHAFRSAGCAGPAYGTIAAGGINATVLHYTSNDRPLGGNDLVLVDAGGEYGGYCADITRTFPVAASYSSAQARLYDLVLAAQEAAIAKAGPGVAHEDVHMTAIRILTEGMIELGLIAGSIDESIETEAYKTFYMHGTSHWLGMDVHDVGSYKPDGSSRKLAPGIVLTVEPGIYIREDAEAPEELRGIGIRIEDDVLITEDGCEVLTSNCPKKRAEIEELRAKALSAAP